MKLILAYLFAILVPYAACFIFLVNAVMLWKQKLSARFHVLSKVYINDSDLFYFNGMKYILIRELFEEILNVKLHNVD